MTKPEKGEGFSLAKMQAQEREQQETRGSFWHIAMGLKCHAKFWTLFSRNGDHQKFD